MTSNKRKVLLINRPFQISFIMYTMGIAAVITLIYYISISYFFWKFEKEGKAVGLSITHPFFRFLSEQHHALNIIFLVTSVVTLSILFLYGLLMSNRIAGPLYNLKKYLNNFDPGGGFAELKFREDDYFNDVADAVNDCLKKINVSN